MSTWTEERKFIEDMQLHYVYRFLTENFIKEKNNNDFVQAYQYVLIQKSTHTCRH